MNGRGTAIRLERCARTFAGGTRAVDAIDLAIEGGETIVLLGPSGCGKTTTLRMIAGLEEPDAGGRILFDANDVTHVPIERRNVGMVFQHYALFPNLDVAGNVGYGLRVHGMERSARQARVAEMLALMQIEPLAKRRVDELSGGQRQRVALARAIAPQPRVLLLDEPLAALDAKLRESLRGEIDALLRKLGITAVYVTHDQSEAMALADRIVVMDAGRIVQTGTPIDIYRRPADRFVAGFIGAMNRIAGRFEDGAFVTAAGRIPFDGAKAGEGEAYFRPQDAAIVDPAKAHIVGTLRRVQFLGDRVRVVVDGLAEEPCIVETADDVDLATGSPVGLAIRPGALAHFTT